MTNLKELLAEQKFYKDLVKKAKEFKQEMFLWGVVRKNMEKIRNHVTNLSKAIEKQKSLFNIQVGKLEQINARINSGETNPGMSLEVDSLCATIDSILEKIEGIKGECDYYNKTKGIFIKGFEDRPWSDERIKDNLALDFPEYEGELTNPIIEFFIFYE